MKDLFKRFFPVTVIVLTVLFVVMQREKEETDEGCSIAIETVRSFLPEVENIKTVDHENCFFALFDSSGDSQGMLLNSSAQAEDPSGFGGKLEVFVLIDNSDTVQGVFQGKHSETGSYINLLENRGFYESWNGLKVEDALEKEVDAITGATMSSNAVTFMVKKNLRLYGGKDFSGIFVKEPFDPVSAAVVIFFVFSLIFFLMPEKTNKFRIILLTSSIIVPGIIAAQMASMEMFFNWLKNGISGGTAPFFIIIVVSMVITLIKRRNIYCYYYCPMGSLQEMLHKIPSPVLRLKPPVLKTLSYIRTFFLLLIAIFMVANIFEDHSFFEPFSSFRINAAAISSMIILIISAASAIFVPRPWCKLCPTGEVFDAVKNCRKIKVKQVQ